MRAAGGPFGNQSGAYVKLNGDGSGTIVTGAQENGSGAVMALPLLVAEVLGMKPSDFSILYQDTDAAPFDAGSSGSQTTMNNGRAVVEAAGEVRDKLLDLAAEKLEVAREDLELADGQVRVVGSPSKAVEIAELAGSGSSCSARAPARCPRTRPATPRAASGGSAWSPSSSRRSSPTPRASRSTARRASSACCRSPPRTTRARSSTASAPPGRCTAASSWGSARRSWRCPSSTPTDASATRTSSTTSS